MSSTKGVSSSSSLPSSSDRASPPKPQSGTKAAASRVFSAFSYVSSWLSPSAWQQTFADLESSFDVEIASPFSAEDFEQQVQEKIAEQRKQQSKVVEVDDGDQTRVDGAKPISEEEARGWAIIAVLQKHMSVSDQELRKQYDAALIKHLPTELPDDDDHDTREKGQADAHKLAGMDVVKSLAKRAGIPEEWCFPSEASPVEASPEVAPEIEGEESEAEEETTQDSPSASESGRPEPTSELSQSDQSKNKKTWNLTLGKVVKFVTYGGMLLLVANSLGGLGVGAATPTPPPIGGGMGLVSWAPTLSTPYMQCLPGDFDPGSYGGMPIIPRDALCIPGSVSLGGCDGSPFSAPGYGDYSPLPLETGSGSSTTRTGSLLFLTAPPTPPTSQSSGAGTGTPHELNSLEISQDEPLDPPASSISPPQPTFGPQPLLFLTAPPTVTEMTHDPVTTTELDTCPNPALSSPFVSLHPEAPQYTSSPGAGTKTPSDPVTPSTVTETTHDPVTTTELDTCPNPALSSPFVSLHPEAPQYTSSPGAGTKTPSDPVTPTTVTPSTRTPTSATIQRSGWGTTTIFSAAPVLYLLWNVRQKGLSTRLCVKTAATLLMSEGIAAISGMGSPLLGTVWNAGTAIVESGMLIASTLSPPQLLVGGTVLGAAALTVGSKALSRPKIKAEDGTTDMETWKKPGVVTRSGYIYDIEVRGRKDLTEAERNKLFDTFQEEMLEKYPRPIRIGDKLEFQIPPNETGKWNATLTPGKGNKEFYALSDPTALRYEHSYTPSITSSESLEKLDVLRDAMVRGSKISITCIQAPTVFPVSFTSADPNFSAAMQRLLSIPEMRKRMETSKHPELNKIAQEYKAMMEQTKPRQLIDLSALEEQVKKNSTSLPAGILFGRGRWVGEDRPINLKDGHTHDSDDWAIAIFRLMSSKGDEVEDLFARQQQFDPSKLDSSNPSHYTKTEFEGLWNDSEKPSEAYHRIRIAPLSTNSDSLVKLVNDKLTESGLTTQFDKAPDFIPIHLEGPITPRDVPTDDLEINHKHIKHSNQSVWYRLDTFSNDDSTITYRTTIELENGIPKKRYWKIDPNNHADPLRITLDQFKKAASTGRDFIYLKQANRNRVSESAIKKKAFVTSETNPTLKTIPITGSSTSVSFDYAYVDPIPTIDAQAGSTDGGADLHNAIYDVLENADRRKKKITIPVPAGQGSNGRDWPIGIILFAVKNYIRDNPGHFTSVKLAITRDEPIKEDRNQLIQAINKADEIVERSPNDFDTFSPAWTKASKSQRKGWRLWGR